jgi:hypothetical protein
MSPRGLKSAFEISDLHPKTLKVQLLHIEVPTGLTIRGMDTKHDLLALLADQGVIPTDQQITLMRHKDRRYPLEKYIGTRALNLYQAMQPRAMPEGSLLISVYGNRPGHGILLGAWRVNRLMSAADAVAEGLTQGSFEPLTPDWPGYFHDLQEARLLDDLVLKLEVEWPGRELSWRRILSRPRKLTQHGKYQVSVRKDPAVPFISLLGASLVMAELRIALREPSWQQGLSQVRGIYVITDERDGHQYIGSASGTQGILSRWSNYAASGHGGNKRLIDLLERTPGRELDFRFTLLETLPADTPRAEVLKRESYWKVALGSRAFGLNLN